MVPCVLISIRSWRTGGFSNHKQRHPVMGSFHSPVPGSDESMVVWGQDFVGGFFRWNGQLTGVACVASTSNKKSFIILDQFSVSRASARLLITCPSVINSNPESFRNGLHQCLLYRWLCQCDIGTQFNCAREQIAQVQPVMFFLSRHPVGQVSFLRV